MIIRNNSIKVDQIYNDDVLVIGENSDIYNNAIFFDLEHYVYKRPVCIGVFGCCIFDKEEMTLNVKQYMIEDDKDALEILSLAKEYFVEMSEKRNKKYIVTFSGNNDYTVINYLFNKYNIGFSIEEHFVDIDLQKEYEKVKKVCIGLKALEKEFGIIRAGELISGSNLAKTFNKIIKDRDYMTRMPEEKKEKILLYNEQDVVNLFHIFVTWNKTINKEAEKAHCEI